MSVSDIHHDHRMVLALPVAVVIRGRHGLKLHDGRIHALDVLLDHSCRSPAITDARSAKCRPANKA